MKYQSLVQQIDDQAVKPSVITENSLEKGIKYVKNKVENKVENTIISTTKIADKISPKIEPKKIDDKNKA